MLLRWIYGADPVLLLPFYINMLSDLNKNIIEIGFFNCNGTFGSC